MSDPLSPSPVEAEKDEDGADERAIGARLRAVIVASGVARSDVAAAARIDTTALSKILNGKRRLSALELALICEAVDADPLQILRGFGAAARDDREFLRGVLEALCQRDGLSLDSEVDPGKPARNYELALRLRIGHIYGLTDDRCRHCGKHDEPDGDHTCDCPQRDEDCTDHPIEAARV